MCSTEISEVCQLSIFNLKGSEWTPSDQCFIFKIIDQNAMVILWVRLWVRCTTLRRNCTEKKRGEILLKTKNGWWINRSPRHTIFSMILYIFVGNLFRKKEIKLVLEASFIIRWLWYRLFYSFIYVLTTHFRDDKNIVTKVMMYIIEIYTLKKSEF